MANVMNANKASYDKSKSLPLCLAPYLGVFKVAQRTSACCEMWVEAENLSFEDYWNSESTKHLRKSLSNHDWDALPEGCKACLNSPSSHSEFYLLEDRQYFVDSFEKHRHLIQPDGSMLGKPLAQMAIGVSTKCNMACRMCTPQISSKKWEVQNAVGLVNDPNIMPEIDSKGVATLNIEEWLGVIKDNLGTLKEIVLHGGDPIQAEGMPELLDALLPIKDTCCINFLSNGTFDTMLDGRNIWEVLKQFKRVHLVFSIDSTPKENDYIRLFGNTKRCLKLIDDAKRVLPKEHYIGVHTTLSNYALINFPEYLQWAEEHLLSRGIWVSLNMVNNPSYYEPSNLPDSIRKDVFRRLSAYQPTDEHYKDLKRIAQKAMFKNKFDPVEWNRCLYLDTQIDKNNKYNIGEVFPLIKPFLKDVYPMEVHSIPENKAKALVGDII